MKSADCVAEIVQAEPSNVKDWKRASKRNDGADTIRQFDNKKINKSCIVTTTNQDTSFRTVTFYSEIIKPQKKGVTPTREIIPTGDEVASEDVVLNGIEYNDTGCNVTRQSYVDFMEGIKQSGWTKFITEEKVSAGTTVVIVDAYETGAIETVIKITKNAYRIKPGDCKGFTCDAYVYLTTDKKDGICISGEPWEIDDDDDNFISNVEDGEKVLQDIKKQYGSHVIIVGHN